MAPKPPVKNKKGQKTTPVVTSDALAASALAFIDDKPGAHQLLWTQVVSALDAGNDSVVDAALSQVIAVNEEGALDFVSFVENVSTSTLLRSRSTMARAIVIAVPFFVPSEFQVPVVPKNKRALGALGNSYHDEGLINRYSSIIPCPRVFRAAELLRMPWSRMRKDVLHGLLFHAIDDAPMPEFAGLGGSAEGASSSDNIMRATSSLYFHLAVFLSEHEDGESAEDDWLEGTMSVPMYKWTKTATRRIERWIGAPPGTVQVCQPGVAHQALSQGFSALVGASLNAALDSVQTRGIAVRDTRALIALPELWSNTPAIRLSIESILTGEPITAFELRLPSHKAVAYSDTVDLVETILAERVGEFEHIPEFDSEDDEDLEPPSAYSFALEDPEDPEGDDTARFVPKFH